MAKETPAAAAISAEGEQSYDQPGTYLDAWVAYAQSLVDFGHTEDGQLQLKHR